MITNYSSEISYTKLRNVLKITGKSTIQNWISYFSQSYIIFTVDRFSFKVKESIMAPKKIFVIDNGLITMKDYRNHEVDFVIRKGRNVIKLIQVTFAFSMIYI
ncbi:hypothetical protein [Ferroplasma sp.]|uniref:DUF4143 domain-containing protein n=1 Tax=Ferroplasma sp. TaxID=2591003 RepID=UPI00307D6B5A